MADDRPWCKFRRYRSREQALAELQKLRTRGREENRLYYCNNCKGFHLAKGKKKGAKNGQPPQ